MKTNALFLALALAATACVSRRTAAVVIGVPTSSETML
jgi:hypothetical protein